MNAPFTATENTRRDTPQTKASSFQDALANHTGFIWKFIDLHLTT